MSHRERRQIFLTALGQKLVTADALGLDLPDHYVLWGEDWGLADVEADEFQIAIEGVQRPASTFGGGAYKAMPKWARDHLKYMGVGDRWFVKRRLSPTRVVYGVADGWEVLADPGYRLILNVAKPVERRSSHRRRR